MNHNVLRNVGRQHVVVPLETDPSMVRPGDYRPLRLSTEDPQTDSPFHAAAVVSIGRAHIIVRIETDRLSGLTLDSPIDVGLLLADNVDTLWEYDGPGEKTHTALVPRSETYISVRPTSTVPSAEFDEHEGEPVDLVIDFGNSRTSVMAVESGARQSERAVERIFFIDREMPTIRPDDDQLDWQPTIRSCLLFEDAEVGLPTGIDAPRVRVGDAAAAFRARLNPPACSFVHSPKLELTQPASKTYCDLSSAPVMLDAEYLVDPCQPLDSTSDRRRPCAPHDIAALFLREVLSGCREYINRVRTDRADAPRRWIRDLYFTVPVSFRESEVDALQGALEYARRLSGVGQQVELLCDEATAVAHCFMYARLVTAQRQDPGSMRDAFGNVLRQLGPRADEGDDDREQSIDVMVVDVGGFTTDVALVSYAWDDEARRIRPTIRHVDGAVFGGDDYTNGLIQAFGSRVASVLGLAPRSPGGQLVRLGAGQGGKDQLLTHALRRSYADQAESAKVSASNGRSFDLRLDDVVLRIRRSVGSGLQKMLDGLAPTGESRTRADNATAAHGLALGRFYGPEGRLEPLDFDAEQILEICRRTIEQNETGRRIQGQLERIVETHRPHVMLLAGRSTRLEALAGPVTHAVPVVRLREQGLLWESFIGATARHDLDKAAVALGASVLLRSVHYAENIQFIGLGRVKPPPRSLFVRGQQDHPFITRGMLTVSGTAIGELRFYPGDRELQILSAFTEDPDAPATPIALIKRKNRKNLEELQFAVRVDIDRPTSLRLVRGPAGEEPPVIIEACPLSSPRHV